MRIIIVGGGVLGTMHAYEAIARGHEVVHLEREQEARGASVRNFGLVWVSGRSTGLELDTALRARGLWERIGEAVPGVGFRPTGSLTVLRSDAEVAVAQAALSTQDAVSRGFTLVDPDEARKLNPVLRGDFMAALHCTTDAAVESRVALPALRAHLADTGRYTFLAGREVRDVSTGNVRDDHGDVHHGDQVILATGAWLSGLVRELAGPELPVRRVRLQMAQTAPLGERLTTAVADADSFRYYPAYDSAARDRMAAVQFQPLIAAAHKMQLLIVQRLDGGLTIGDTHEYDEPFAFDVIEEPYDHLVEAAEALLGRKLPRARRRWAGVYSQATEPDRIVHRQRIDEGVHLVTGPGGRGMTCSPAIAETTATDLSW